jgi:hypothetical protein
MSVKLRCPGCEGVLDFNFKRSFMKHVDTHLVSKNIEIPFNCKQPFCTKMFSELTSYGTHLLDHRKDDASSYEDCRSFKKSRMYRNQ